MEQAEIKSEALISFSKYENLTINLLAELIKIVYAYSTQ